MKIRSLAGRAGALGLVGASLLTACSVSAGGTGTVSKATVESETAQQLAKEKNQPVPTVVCPGDLDAKVGATMTCTLTAQGSTTQYAVTLTVDSVKGSDAHWTAQVGDSPIGSGPSSSGSSTTGPGGTTSDTGGLSS